MTVIYTFVCVGTSDFWRQTYCSNVWSQDGWSGEVKQGYVVVEIDEVVLLGKVETVDGEDLFPRRTLVPDSVR